MKRILFLEYKFRDFTDEELEEPNPTGVIASLEKLNKERWEQIKRIFAEKGVSFVSLPGGDVCPASKDAEGFLKEKVRSALSYKPDVIWFDHLRFEGHWEKAREVLPKVHKDCEFCGGKNRGDIIVSLAKKILKLIPKRVKTGYFAIPFKEGEYDNWEVRLGQVHRKLGNIFSLISPLLYHRMIGKPVGYISEYTRYLASLPIKAKILPIIQLKDMPDKLVDKLTISEIGGTVKEAIKPPSTGVAIFSWDQAIEKGKLQGVSEILRGIS